MTEPKGRGVKSAPEASGKHSMSERETPYE